LERGWVAGPYRIVELAPALWVLTREDRHGWEIIDFAELPDQLVPGIRHRLLQRRVLAVTLVFLVSLGALVAGSLAGSLLWVSAASLAIIASIMGLSDCLTDPRTALEPVSV
jgi:hypothetical protein